MGSVDHSSVKQVPITIHILTIQQAHVCLCYIKNLNTVIEGSRI